jgi:hypothetical protein
VRRRLSDHDADLVDADLKPSDPTCPCAGGRLVEGSGRRERRATMPGLVPQEPDFGPGRRAEKTVWTALRDQLVLAVNGFRDLARAREMLYVGLSRARTQLAVCGDLDEIAAVGGEGVRRRLVTGAQPGAGRPR